MELSAIAKELEKMKTQINNLQQAILTSCEPKLIETVTKQEEYCFKRIELVPIENIRQIYFEIYCEVFDEFLKNYPTNDYLAVSYRQFVKGAVFDESVEQHTCKHLIMPSLKNKFTQYLKYQDNTYVVMKSDSQLINYLRDNAPCIRIGKSLMTETDFIGKFFKKIDLKYDIYFSNFDFSNYLHSELGEYVIFNRIVRLIQQNYLIIVVTNFGNIISAIDLFKTKDNQFKLFNKKSEYNTKQLSNKDINLLLKYLESIFLLFFNCNMGLRFLDNNLSLQEPTDIARQLIKLIDSFISSLLE